MATGTDINKPIASPKPGVGRKRARVRARIANLSPGTKAGVAIGASDRVIGNLVREVIKAKKVDRNELLKKVRTGLPYASVETLMKAYSSSQKEIGEVLLISTSTMSRRKSQGRLQADESDRVVRLARIMDEATSMMKGDRKAAAQWMHTPRDILGGETPLQHVTTEIGARDVEDLIGRIRHGVFS